MTVCYCPNMHGCRHYRSCRLCVACYTAAWPARVTRSADDHLHFTLYKMSDWLLKQSHCGFSPQKSYVWQQKVGQSHNSGKEAKGKTRTKIKKQLQSGQERYKRTWLRPCSPSSTQRSTHRQRTWIRPGSTATDFWSQGLWMFSEHPPWHMQSWQRTNWLLLCIGLTGWVWTSRACLWGRGGKCAAARAQVGVQHRGIYHPHRDFLSHPSKQMAGKTLAWFPCIMVKHQLQQGTRCVRVSCLITFHILQLFTHTKKKLPPAS